MVEQWYLHQVGLPVGYEVAILILPLFFLEPKDVTLNAYDKDTAFGMVYEETDDWTV